MTNTQIHKGTAPEIVVILPVLATLGRSMIVAAVRQIEKPTAQFEWLLQRDRPYLCLVQSLHSPQ